MSLFAPAPEPATELGRLRVLSPRAGVRVSPLCLGAMSIGEAWKEGMGSMDKSSSFALLDAFVEAGGNFIDTANNYQNEESELWIGEWMKKRGNRDEIVLATKYTTYYRHKNAKNMANYCGNHTKSLHVSVEDSLHKLQTSYIDVLYLHWWEYSTSIVVLMQGLNNLVRAGKVLYLGISDTPAWVVSKANQYARDHGLAQFVVYQGKWSVAERDFEREIIPMCLSEGMALAPWGALGSGKFQSSADLEKRKKAGEGLRSLFGPGGQSEEERKMSAALEKVGKEVGTDSVTAVAIAYCMAKTPYVFPIVGGRKVEHLKANIKALSLHLTPEHIQELEAVTSDFQIGFPHNMIGTDFRLNGGQVNFLMAMSGQYSMVLQPSPIQAKTQ